MDSPCKQCIGLAICSKRPLDYNLEICSILRSAIIRESNILDPKGLSQLVILDDTEMHITLNIHTDSSYTPIQRSKQFLVSYIDKTYHHDYYNEVLLGEYDQICNEVKSFYNKPYIGME